MMEKSKNKGSFRSRLQKPKISYQQAGLDPREIENRLSRAFDILFEEVIKNREKDAHRRHLTAYDN